VRGNKDSWIKITPACAKSRDHQTWGRKRSKGARGKQRLKIKKEGDAMLGTNQALQQISKGKDLELKNEFSSRRKIQKFCWESLTQKREYQKKRGREKKKEAV